MAVCVGAFFYILLNFAFYSISNNECPTSVAGQGPPRAIMLLEHNPHMQNYRLQL